jgi:endonuclease YncB( thermonuclease family)
LVSRNTPGLNERAQFIDGVLPAIDKDPALAEAELRGKVRGPVITGAKLTRVVDGDTIYLEVPKGTALPGADLRSFRLAGVDVPESNTPEGKRAAAALAEFLQGKTLTFQAEKADNFGRNLIALKADGVSVSDWLIQNNYGKERAIADAPADKYPLSTYRQVIPLLKQVEAMPEFAYADGTSIGSQKE